MTKTAIGLLLAALLPIPLGIPQSGRPSNNYLDAAVDSKGTVYVLAHQRIVAYNAAGERADVSFDAENTVSDPRFNRLILQAIAISDRDDVVLLWSGLRSGGTVETYVCFTASGRSVRLERPLGTAMALALAPQGGIFVFGIPKQSPLMLIHEFDSGGKYVRSFHPHKADNGADTSARRTSSRSQIVYSGECLWVLSPLMSSLIFEYRDGVLTRTIDLTALGTKGAGRSVHSIFRANGSVMAHVFIREALRGESRHEIVRVSDGHVYRSIRSDEITGPVLGITPEGRVIERNVSLGPSRNTVSFR